MICASSSGAHPTISNDVDILCRTLDEHKCVRVPVASTIAKQSMPTPLRFTPVRHPLTLNDDETSILGAWQVIRILFPRTLTIVSLRNLSPPPPPGRSIGLIGTGGTTEINSKPCTPMDSGVGLGIKPCVAISREASIRLDSRDYGVRCAVSGDRLRDRA